MHWLRSVHHLKQTFSLLNLKPNLYIIKKIIYPFLSIYWWHLYDIERFSWRATSKFYTTLQWESKNQFQIKNTDKINHFLETKICMNDNQYLKCWYYDREMNSQIFFHGKFKDPFLLTKSIPYSQTIKTQGNLLSQRTD